MLQNQCSDVLLSFILKYEESVNFSSNNVCVSNKFLIETVHLCVVQASAVLKVGLYFIKYVDIQQHYS